MIISRLKSAPPSMGACWTTTHNQGGVEQEFLQGLEKKNDATREERYFSFWIAHKHATTMHLLAHCHFKGYHWSRNHSDILTSFCHLWDIFLSSFCRLYVIFLSSFCHHSVLLSFCFSVFSSLCLSVILSFCLREGVKKNRLF